MLAALDAVLGGTDLPRVVVTYGGGLHDIPVLKRRAAASWMFDLRGLADGMERDHHDLMTDDIADGARWSSLRDECAALAIPIRENLANPGCEDGRTMRKCQADVCAAFLLYLHRQAMIDGRANGLFQGWTALADLLSRSWPSAAHLRSFHDGARLKIAREHLASDG